MGSGLLLGRLHAPGGVEVSEVYIRLCLKTAADAIWIVLQRKFVEISQRTEPLAVVSGC